MSKKKSVIGEVWIKIGNEYVGHMRKKRIHLTSKSRGHLSDGRPVKKVARKGWVYAPTK